MTTYKNLIQNREDISLSFKFGFIGLGMGGGSIAAACADIKTKVSNNFYPYSALLINSNKMDLEKIKPKNGNTNKLLIGDGRGAGRNIDKGQEIFLDSTDKVLKAVDNQFRGTEFIWVVAGLGGGSGTGAILDMCQLLHKNGFPGKFGLILTLPRKSEGLTVLYNALNRLEIIQKAIGNLGAIIVVDNQKLFKRFLESNPNATVPEYLSYSNDYVAEALHEMNVITASHSAYGEFHFDSSEFENLIKTPGYLHFARFSLQPSDVDSSQYSAYAGKLKALVEEGVLSDGYNLKRADRMALSVLANSKNAGRVYNMEFMSTLETALEEISPQNTERPVAQYQYESQNNHNIYFNAVFAGLSAPGRLKELMQEYTEMKQQQDAETNDEEDIFANFSAPAQKKVNAAASDDLFGMNTKSNSIPDVSDDLFSGLSKK